MATFLIELPRDDMIRRIGEALNVYVTAMSYPAGTGDNRQAMWLEHTRRHGWRAVAAVEAADPAHRTPSPAELRNAPLVGVAYGYRGAPDQWWQQQVILGLRRQGTADPRIASLTADYFELTELHIAPHAQGRGLGEALARRLLRERPESHVLLSTPEVEQEDNRAWRLYRRLGFIDVMRRHHFVGDPRAFAILGRTLPL